VPDALTDEVLLAAQKGSQSAFATIYRDLAPRVSGYLKARGASDPDGITSDVFLAVLPKLTNLNGGAAGLRTFVFSVAHHRLVDDLRKWQRQPYVAEYEPDLDDRIHESAEEGALESLGTSSVVQMLRRLNPDQRSVLALRVVADLTVEQVAEILGKSTGAVKQLQRRGLIELRRLLEGADVTL
jgi:RNA polymerase sigma-70 factor (ECF subfamily)